MSFSTKLREAIWFWVTRNHPMEEVLKRRHMIARWVLYPLDTFYWAMQRSRGFDVRRNAWEIHGKVYPAWIFACLAKQEDGTRVIFRTDGRYVRFEIIYDEGADAV